MDRDSLALLLAQGLSLAEIGRRFGRDPSTVAYWVNKHDLRIGDTARHAARGGLALGQLRPFAEAGASLKTIASELGMSVSSVRYWLDRHDLAELRRANRGARAHGGKQHVELVCPVHGLSRHVLRTDQECYRCTQCRSDAVTRRRRRVKAILVDEAGGRCALCGYDRCNAALQFHHLDPAAKRFALSRRGVTRSLAEARAEAGKCVLLCSNCHAEVEAGVTLLSRADRQV